MNTRTHLLPVLVFLLALILAGCDPVVSDIFVSCSVSDLIDAINTANDSPAATTLHLDPGCVYELTAAVTSDHEFYPAGVGLPEITTPMIIDGQNATIKRSDDPGTPEFRLFLVAPQVDLTINDCTLQGGDVRSTESFGGAILSDGPLEINSSVLSDNYAQNGGAVYCTSKIDSEGTTYENNAAERFGGAIYNTYGHHSNNDQFINNSAHMGGAIYNDQDTVDIYNSVFEQNHTIPNGSVPGSGGAILNYGENEPTLLKENELLIYDSTFTNNYGGHGGAVSNGPNAILEAVRCTFQGNHAWYGGAIHNMEDLRIDQSAFWDNQAEFQGGAIYNWNSLESSFWMVNNTLSSNQVLGSASTDSGSAIYQSDGFMQLDYQTISMNSGAPALYIVSGTVRITNSIVASNTSADCGGAGLSNFLVDGSANLDSDGTCTDFTITADPELKPLADNGGNTKTHALKINSPALDAVVSTCWQNDQRGEARPYGPACDLGAFESHDYVVQAGPSEPEGPVVVETESIPVPEEPHKEPNWWWKFEGYVCSESSLTEFYLSTDADPELFSLTINEKPVKCYQQSYDKTRYWCHVELSMLEWEIPSEISFCVGDLCESIQRNTLNQERCEGDNPPTEPEPQVCSSFETFQNCSAAPGCVWQCSDMASAQLCSCMPEE